MKVLVTGGTGVVGTAAVRALQARDIAGRPRDEYLRDLWLSVK